MCAKHLDSIFELNFYSQPHARFFHTFRSNRVIAGVSPGPRLRLATPMCDEPMTEGVARGVAPRSRRRARPPGPAAPRAARGTCVVILVFYSSFRVPRAPRENTAQQLQLRGGRDLKPVGYLPSSQAEQQAQRKCARGHRRVFVGHVAHVILHAHLARFGNRGELVLSIPLPHPQSLDRSRNQAQSNGGPHLRILSVHLAILPRGRGKGAWGHGGVHAVCSLIPLLLADEQPLARVSIYS